MDFMDVLVQRAPVQRAMHPVVPGILEDEEDGDLVSHSEERGEGHASLETDVLRHWVEEPNLRQLDSEVAHQNQLRAVPLLLRRRHLLLCK